MTSDAKPFPRETRDPIEDVWGPRTPYHGDWPERVDEHVEEEVGKWVQSACVMCSNGCGADIGVSKDGKRIVGIRGRGVDRVNKGRLGPKGMCSWEYNGHPQRLTSPQVRKNGKLEDVSWDEAMNLIVEQSNKIRKALTPHAIAFYTSGQLFLEEYHALAMVGKGGLGTLTMDGNTRLCTASAAAAMRENFGSDGQPGSYTDVDVTDCLWITGHNVAATQTVLWARMLDRFEGPKPPKCVVIDPRLTPTAELAVKHGIHLKPNNGTNLALLNGIQHVMFEKDWIRWDYVNKNTIGVDELRDTVKGYDPKRVEEITGVPAADIEKAARILWESKTVLATALQGVYQSNQAVASACQINNVQLLMGNIGKPGGGVYQMNGQPTAQNNREAGCNGEYPGFRNNNNPQHMEELAKLWNINVWDLPAWQDPIHIMSMLQMMEAGTIKMLWISGTNPAVSLVNLERVRKILTMPGLYVIAQDIFETETTQLADIVLPAAMWGEKTGCFTNVDRTVHISHKAIEPPGLAKSDLDIFLDYAKRMQFKNKDGEDLLPFHDSESAFEHWRSTTGGRVCDYTGMSYANLSEGSGIQWPCNAKAPKGTERLYTDANFMTRENDAESFGHDLETGTPIDPKTYAKMNPNGRAILKKCNYRAPVDGVNKDYPLGLLTGRNHLHFHTRTKTGRSARLNKADPDPYVQIHPEDAEPLGIKTGDYVKVESIHGVIEVPAKLGKIDKGQIFVPFHFGTVVDNNGQGRAGTANELTQPTWDYTSKQPTFKTGGVRISKVTEKGPVVETKQKVAVRSLEDPVYAQDQKKEDDFSDRIRHIEDYLGLWDDCTKQLLIQLDELIDTLKGDFEIASGMMIVKDFVHQAKEKLKPFSEKYGSNYQAAERDVKAIHDALFPDYRKGHGSLELLMDLQGLLTMIGYTNGFLTALLPVSQGLHDKDFAAAVKDADLMMIRSLEWCRGQIKVKAAHTLIVPAPPSAGRLAPDQ